MRDHHTPPQMCLACGHLFNRAGTFGEDAPPRPGDLTVCVRCAHLMAFTDGLRLRELTDAERKEADADEDTQLTLRAVREVQFVMLGRSSGNA